jgi:toxin ParE1/3/4
VKLTLTALARADIDIIANHTLENWGASKLHDYMGGLLDLIDQIAVRPMLGRSVPRIPARFRRVAYRSHFVFYTKGDDEVRIIRILHQSMDHGRHLN